MSVFSVSRLFFSFPGYFLLLFLVSLVGCDGGGGSDDGGAATSLEPASQELLISQMSPDFGLAGTLVNIETESPVKEDTVVVFSGNELIPEWISEDRGTISFRVPDDALSGPIQLRSGLENSNNLWFSVSENGVIAPPENKIVSDELGNRISIDTLMVSLTAESDTREEAERLATLVSGEVVGRISLMNAWQIRISADSLEILEANATTLKAEPSVEFTLFDIEIKGDAINWSGDPDHPEQRERNRVEEGAALYESKVHPTAEGKHRPFFMAIGISEGGIDFHLDDFSDYNTSGTTSSGNVTIYAGQKNSLLRGDHGSNVTGIIAAELGDKGNAGIVRALSNSHGGANIDVGMGIDSINSFGRLAQTTHQLEAGSTVINWSWGLIREGAVNCEEVDVGKDKAYSKSIFNDWSLGLKVFFSTLKGSYPSAVIVSSAGNAATDAGEKTYRIPSSVESSQVIVVGAHTTGGTLSAGGSDDDAAKVGNITPCFDKSIDVGVKRAFYSNYGERVDISASGSIRGWNNDQHIGKNEGTSFAAPLVTATVALMQSINPNLTPAEIKSLLRGSALPIENKVVLPSGESVFTRSLTEEESATYAGKGARLNVEGAIQAALDSVADSSARVGAEVIARIGAGVDEVTKTVELVIPDDGAVFDKVDIMFLIDVSSSYRDDISTFISRADDLVDAFDAAGSDVKIGLASFSDYPQSPYGGLSDYPYRLDLALTDEFPKVKGVLSSLSILYGDDSPESQYEGLYQSAQLASGWREGALPLIFLATDASFHDSDSETSYPGHGHDAALAALTGQSISVFGLQSGGSVIDVVNIVNETGGQAFDLSRDSSEIVEAVKNALSETDTDISVELIPFGDFARLVKTITPQIEGGQPGEPITNVNPGDTVKFDVVFGKGNFASGSTQTFSFRFKVVAEGVATIMEVPVTVVIN